MLSIFRKIDVELRFALATGLFLALSLVPGLGGLVWLAVLSGARYSAPEAWKTLASRRIDVDVLMIIASAGAIALNRPAEAAMLLFLFSLSHALEHYAMGRTERAVEALIKLRPTTATRVRSGLEETVPVEALVVGDVIRIRAFEAVPVDGVALSAATLDLRSITGESTPVRVQREGNVVSGAQNMEEAFDLTVTTTVEDSLLNKIIELVRSAQDNKASGEHISRWFGQRYTALVLISAIVIFFVRWGIQDLQTAAYGSLILLVALSPCALVISVPSASLSALAWCARNGILVRGSLFIERAAGIKSIVFDKTGTLTTGIPRLVEICLCRTQEEESCWHGEGTPSPVAQEIIRYAASAEAGSQHPIATSLLQLAKDLGLELIPTDQQRAVPGLGVEATIAGKSVLIGQEGLFQQLGIEVPTGVIAQSHQSEGRTVALARIGDDFVTLAFADSVREEAKDAMARLRRLGVKNLELLSGDNASTVTSVAKQVGVDQFRAAMLPDQKAQRVRELASQAPTMMVGDGINDAPALASAQIGVAMGGTGSDIAMKSADIVLMRDDLRSLPAVIALGKKTNRVIRANLVFGGLVIGALSVFSLIDKLPLPIAVLGHEGSTLLVILNGLRLLAGPKNA